MIYFNKYFGIYSYRKHIYIYNLILLLIILYVKPEDKAFQLDE